MFQVSNLRYEQPDLRPIKESGKLYRLNANTIFKWEVHKAAESFDFRLIIRKGFLTNGLTASRIGAIFGLGRDGIHRAAVCLHDFLYKHGGNPPMGELSIFIDNSVYVPSDITFSREEVDALFMAMLIDAGVKGWHCFLAYWSVRVFGRLFWEEDNARK